MSNIPNIEEYKQKIYEKLVPSGWGRVFKSFIFSTEFENILLNLHSLSQDGHRFTPPLKDVFRAFEECPYDELKVVIVGQDPYPTLGVADGIAFSCSKSEKEQPSLRFIHDEIEKLYPIGTENYERPLNLAKWSRSGILLMNTAFTTEVGKIGKHYDIWAPMVAYIFDYLKNFNPGLVYVYMGKKSMEWADMCGENCTKFMVSHPASAAYNGSKWDSKDVFLKVRDTVQEIYNYKIQW
jgi:uracil-DNA glycosylase